MKAYAKLLFGLPLALASVALFALMALTFSDVILRSVANAPIEAATELTRLLMAVVVFSALPLISWRGQQITVDLLDGIFHRFRLSRALDAVVSMTCGVLLWFPARRIVDLANRAKDYGDRTEYLSIPTYFITWFVAVSVFLTMAVLILRGLILIFAKHPYEVLEHD